MDIFLKFNFDIYQLLRRGEQWNLFPEAKLHSKIKQKQILKNALTFQRQHKATFYCKLHDQVKLRSTFRR